MDLQKNLRHYRELAGYKTAKDFASALNIPYNTYTAYENQKREPKLDMVVKIANILNISTDELLGRTVANKTEQLKNKIINVLKHSNDKYFEIKNIDSSMITFTISNDDEKLTDVKYRTKDFVALVELVETVHAKKIKDDIYDLASRRILETAIQDTKRNIKQIENNKDKNVEKKSMPMNKLLNKLYEIDRTLQKQIEKSKKQENK